MRSLDRDEWTAQSETAESAKFALTGECRCAPRIRDRVFLLYWLPEGGINAVEAITNDLSASGVCIDVDRDIPPGTELYLELYAPQDYHKKFLQTVYVKATVVWQRELDSGGVQIMNRVGISFTVIDQADQEKIYRYTEDGFVNRG